MQLRSGRVLGTGRRAWPSPQNVGRFLASLAAYAATQAGSAAYNYVSTRHRPPGLPSGTQNSTRSGVTTTAQHDYSRQYRYKRMPRYKRKRWVKALKRNTAMDLNHVATRTVLRNDTLTSAVPVTDQAYIKCHIYGREGDTDGTEAGNNDLSVICQRDTDINNQRAFQMYFTSAVMDATIRNSGTTNLEVDVYELYYKDTTKFPSFEQMYVAAYNAVDKAGLASTGKLGINNRGATLFDLPELIRYGRIKILKKTKIYLPAGNTANYQMRIPANYEMNSNNLIDDIGYIIRGKTRSLIVVAKNIVGTEATGEIKVGLTRKYAYKLIENKVTKGTITV